MRQLIIAVVFIAAGCTSNPYHADEVAAEHYERVARQCNSGTVVVKRTGSRIRRDYSREALLSAQCAE